MNKNIQTLRDVASELELLAYDVKLTDNAVLVNANGFATVITQAPSSFVINTQIATLGDVGEDNLTQFFGAILDANTRIHPFAFGILTAEDTGEQDEGSWPVVLIDSLPIGDLSTDELDRSFQALLSGILNSEAILREHLEQQPVGV